MTNSIESSEIADSYWDETLPSFSSDPLKIIPYRGMLNAAVNNSNHRVMLLGEGYVFDAFHTKSDVMPYLSKEASGEYPIKLRGVVDVIGIDLVCIENIVGTFYGAVCFNEAGLLFYIPFSLPVSVDGSLTIIG
jgi:hypothetical protein